MRILLLLLLIFPITAYGQITKPGVEGQNAGSPLGRALTVNCDGNCIICTMSNTIMTISFSSSCSSSPSESLTFLSIPLQFQGTLLQFKGD